MKTIGMTLTMILVTLCTGLLAQENVSNPNKEGVYQVVEFMPEFPGGIAAMQQFLLNNIKYPEQAKKDSITGKVFVQFVIDKSGKVTDCKILRSASPLLDAEAVRVVEAMPAWTPGKQKGETVKVAYVLPIAFALK